VVRFDVETHKLRADAGRVDVPELIQDHQRLGPCLSGRVEVADSVVRVAEARIRLRLSFTRAPLART
jgi:hypothetical protein